MKIGNDGREELLQLVLSTLSSLKGVRKAFYLNEELRREVGKIEKDRSVSLGPLTVHNDGVLQCLSRTHVACIVKDSTFRLPPAPTVVLVDENDRTIGRELVGGEIPEPGPGQKLIYLGKDFVIFYDGGRTGHTRFVLPPIPFEEVERIEQTTRVCSSSPSTDGDFFLRKSADLPDDPKLATILIGFDLDL